MSRLQERSTADLLVLIIASTICSVVGLAMVAIFVLELVHPEQNTSDFASGIADVLTTLIGLLAGFLAGRTDAQIQDRQKAESDETP